MCKLSLARDNLALCMLGPWPTYMVLTLMPAWRSKRKGLNFRISIYLFVFGHFFGKNNGKLIWFNTPKCPFLVWENRYSD